MASLIYNGGLDLLKSDWTTGTYKWLLLKGSGYTVNRDHDFVSDLTPASNEVTVSPYARQAVASPTTTVDDTLDRVTYDAADPAFGALAAGETVSAMVLFKFITNDAASRLVAFYDLVDTATSGGAFTVVLAAAGVYYTTDGT